MKKFILVKTFILGGILIFSFAEADVALAAVCDIPMNDVAGIISWGSCILIKTVVPFLFSLATVGFIWGVMQYYLNPGNEEKRKKGKAFIVGGLIGLFVMISMWGIVGVLSNTFKVENTIPQIK